MSRERVGRSARLAWFLVALLALAGASAAAERVYAPGGLAIGGYDVVAYFTLGRASRGEARFVQPFQGVTYRFASARNRDLFLADPTRYLPAYGGYSAYGVANGRLVPGNPEIFTIVEQRLYLEASKELHSVWLRDPALYIGRADEQWPALQ